MLFHSMMMNASCLRRDKLLQKRYFFIQIWESDRR